MIKIALVYNREVPEEDEQMVKEALEAVDMQFISEYFDLDNPKSILMGKDLPFVESVGVEDE